MKYSFENFLLKNSQKNIIIVTYNGDLIDLSSGAKRLLDTQHHNVKSLNSLYPDLLAKLKEELDQSYGRDVSFDYGKYLAWALYLSDELICVELQDQSEIFSLRDEISHLKNLLQKTEELASLGDLVAQMSHEINTPLGICITSASHYQEELQKLGVAYSGGSLTNSQLKAFLKNAMQASQLINSNLKRASNIVTGLRSLAANTRRYDRERMRLGDQVTEVIKQMQPLLDKKNVQVSLDEIDNKIIIKESPSAISQVFSNLIMNSLRHGFRQSIDSPKISIAAHVHRDDITIIYADNGSGVPTELKDDIFDPFVTGSKDGVSSGLGLSIVKEIVRDQFGGDIKLKNSDVGVCFEVLMRTSK